MKDSLQAELKNKTKKNSMEQITRSKKAQISSVDVFIAVALLVIVLLIYIVAFTNLINKPFLVSERDSLEFSSHETASALLSSSGSPHDWYLQKNITPLDVTGLGLVDGSVKLDMQRAFKLQEFAATNESYNQLKKALGIEKYELYILMTKNTTFATPKQGFLDLNSRIAYTWGASDGEEGNASHFGLREFLITNTIPFTDYGGDWQTLITEIDQYDIVIFEDPQIKDKAGGSGQGLNGNQRHILQDWVSAGGTFVQKELGTMLEIFDVSVNNAAHEDGTVVALDGMLRDLNIGDHVEVYEGYRVSKNSGTITTLIQHEPSDHTLFGYWSYGDGLVYYIPDTEGDVTLPNETISHTNLRGILALYAVNESGYTGNGTSFEIGRNYAGQDAVEVALVHETQTVDTDAAAYITFALWRRK